MKILTCNNIPVCISDNVDSLINRKNEIIDRIKNDDAFQILHVEEDSISYHTGITYVTDVFEINNIEVLP
jgi:hypothetical protein